MFRSLSGANRYAVLYRIESAKRADTRARRIDEFVAMLTVSVKKLRLPAADGQPLRICSRSVRRSRRVARGRRR